MTNLSNTNLLTAVEVTLFSRLVILTVFPATVPEIIAVVVASVWFGVIPAGNLTFTYTNPDVPACNADVVKETTLVDKLKLAFGKSIFLIISAF